MNALTPHMTVGSQLVEVLPHKVSPASAMHGDGRSLRCVASGSMIPIAGSGSTRTNSRVASASAR